MRRAKVVVLVSSFVAVGAFMIVALVPREVCGCISPDIRFRGEFGVSAGDDPERAVAAVLARFPVGTDSAQVRAACAKLNDSVVRTACTIEPAGGGCSCSFRTESSLLGWYQRHVTVQFEIDVGGRLKAVHVERTSSLF